ncbi:MAG: hypothetical protein JWL99_1417 [Streptomyces oryziradicis]|nr:hypothetical protein [Actinacidiphila oryziradicis]
MRTLIMEEAPGAITPGASAGTLTCTYPLWSLGDSNS